MTMFCLVFGLWGDSGPGYEAALDRVEEHTFWESAESEYMLIRHLPFPEREWTDGEWLPAACGPMDESMHWAALQKISDERDWPHANYYHALKLGYGNYYDQHYHIQRPRDVAGFLREDLGDGKSLDLPRSFALLRRAAEQGLPGAQMALIDAYLTGKWGKDGALQVGVNPDAAKEVLHMALDIAEKYSSDPEWTSERITEKYNLMILHLQEKNN